MKDFSDIKRGQDIFFIAEIGGNHEGDYEYAIKLTELGIKSGADAIKFQLYTGDTLVSKVEGAARNEHFKKFELSKDNYLYLAKMCQDAGTMFMSSIWDEQMLDTFDHYIRIYKVGAGDLTCLPMIKKFVGTGKPIILSTGLATMDDVRFTVDFIKDIDRSYIENSKLALLQCTSSYPCPDEDANIDAMIALKNEFGLPVGYSDHTVGTKAIEIATAMGAQIIEKHFTDIRENKEYRDHKISLTYKEVQQFLQKVKKIKKLKGMAEKFVTPSEKDANHHVSFHRSIYAKVALSPGDILTEENITVLRPAHGIPARDFYKVLGKTVNKSFKELEVLNQYDIC